METTPTPETAWIPQEAPAGVFVPNNQTPVAIDAPVVTQPVAPVAAPETAQTPVASMAGPLDKLLTWLAKFFAKVTGQPDPITGAVNTSKAATTTWNIVGKVWNTANQVVAKAGDAAGKAVDTVNQATEKIQQVIPPQAAPQTPVESAPVAPVAPVAEVTPPTQPAV